MQLTCGSFIFSATRATIALTLFTMLMQCGCGLPDDAALLAQFETDRVAIERLMTMITEDAAAGRVPAEFILRQRDHASRLGLGQVRAGEYDSARRKACPGCDIVREAKTASVLLTVKSSGILVKGEYKGFAYCPIPPDGLMVSLDRAAVGRIEDCRFHFRAINGPWYLYYQNCP